MKFNYDYIVIGSGFGGSVMSCRLVEKGYNVCLLERGRQWKMHEFPRRPHDVQKNMFWSPNKQKFGLMEFRDNAESDAMSLTASGLGGGSLIYANVLYKMPADFFKGWPGQISRDTLEPHYEEVLKVMEATPYPFETSTYYRNTSKTQYFKTAFDKIKYPADLEETPKFSHPPLAVRFQGDFPGHQTKNSHGAIQSRCNKCGDCDIGCNIHAKNTLDLNYIFKARTHLSNPLQIRTHADVIRIEAVEDYYKVVYVIPEFPLQECFLTAKKVILSAGSIGSTSLLLKMRKHGHLPKLNSWLGKCWSGNGDLLGIVVKTKNDVDSTDGPVITSSIEYKFKNKDKDYPHGMYLQDAGCPVGFSWYISGKLPQMSGWFGLGSLLFQSTKKFLKRKIGLHDNTPLNVSDEVGQIIDRADFAKKVFILLGMGRDKPDGEIRLRDDDEATLHWRISGSQTHFDRLRTEMKKIGTAMQGIYIDNPLTHLNKIIAVHPLGGCPMGDNENSGFVDTNGEVFGYPGLYVIDGSIIPTSTGPNPSLTIAALAEWIASKIPTKSTIKAKNSVSDNV